MKNIILFLGYAVALVSSQLLPSRQYIEPPATVVGFRSVGCYSDNSNFNGQRTLKHSSSRNDAMTLDLCAQTCSNFKYFGVEYGTECYCSSTLTERTLQLLPSACNHPCAGNSSQPCGAGNALNIFEKASDPPTLPPVTPKAAGEFYHVACLKDSTSPRRLPNVGIYGPEVSVQLCAKICNGYEYFGVEYARERFCGDKTDLKAELPERQSACNMLCAGNVSEFCGGVNQISVYQKCRNLGQVLGGALCVLPGLA
ncbi:WSC domain-containing protein [Fulvia fulva]|uniref:WSC domain-containing protein n=1 Tax=Passalora fulva TaxID=5499 RepID=A0A9Q8PIH2_PASFU|nr:WSC domain-containing protein [Fulvia fulva]KAK4626052.1 WSC domain-containing protein [Fulvia fulva]KAK4627775.1 WSC domain-containing protein [Fulvia fulva]UJO23264.1 WSC domain-containing protein [Fulvia fulva]WPV13860.1 WSC domain-containing protein [Fulvia fulva]WPV28958.1 WSC domain-containing protein [Fulvia fulva]